MIAPKEGRKERGPSLRRAILAVVLALAYVLALSQYKAALLDRFAQQAMESLKARHAKVQSLFQASFYFFYDEQFVPGIKQALTPVVEGPSLSRITILSGTGTVLYDSAAPTKVDRAGETPAAVPFTDQTVISHLGSQDPFVSFQAFDTQVLMPSTQFSVLYTFDGSAIRTRLLILLAAGLALGLLVWRLASRSFLTDWGPRIRGARDRFWRLRVKFLVTIVLINLVTAVIVFYTLTSLQTREQSHRIEKESILFSQFSTGRVISDFTNYYYFYYLDRFLPEIKNTIASNENLVGIRIISRRTKSVLFDSEQASAGPTAVNAPESARAEIPAEIEEQLKSRDFATQYIQKNGERFLSVISTYRNENQDALFWIEYLFSFHSLTNNIRAIRRQILLDLVPSLAFGLLIAAVFAQFLISPIRRLVTALRRVTSGDFNVSVDVESADEIGELVQAFNTMTGELKKKKELRKYLSDSTYRKVMNAPEGIEGAKIGGSRVSATVLFSDIRDFVSHCENMEAEEVTAMLNEYFSEMVDVVYKHGGEVDKFIGDALLAVFYSTDEVKTIRPAEGGAERSSSTTALRAIYCALEMRDRLAEFNERRRGQGKRVIEIGVGITHGELISGPIGAKDRMDFTVIGDVVNLANRIEKLSKTGKYTKIVFSNHVEERIRGLLNYAEHSHEKVRGKQEDVVVFELIGIRDIQSMMENLSGADVVLKRRSVELLGHSGNTEALPALLRTLSDKDEQTRLFAAAAVAKLAPKDDRVVVDAFLAAIREEKSLKILSSMITSLGKVCASDRILDLAVYLEHSDERIVANAIEAIGQARDLRCIDLILPKLYSRNNRIKANAAMALFAAGHIEVIDTLKPMLMHSEALMRSSAAFAIGELTAIADYSTLIRSWKDERQNTKVFLAELQEAVPMLVALLRDPDIIVRRQSVIALGKIKDKSAVLPIIGMIEPEIMSADLSRDIQEALRSIGSHKVVREVISRLP